MIRDRKTGNYLLYAFGEIVLVIAGILIALQIDNWNSDRQDRAALHGYLGSIARNMSFDLGSLEKLRARRDENVLRSISTFQGLTTGRQEIDEIIAASRTLSRAKELSYFNSNTSGYEALKSSGLVGKLQGNDAERLLFDYYNTVDRISRMEADHNTMIRDLRLLLLNEYPEDLEEWEFSNPESLTPERFDELQQAYERLLTGDAFARLLNQSINMVDVIGEYSRALGLGRAFVQMLDNGVLQLDEESRAEVRRLEGFTGETGSPLVVENGRIQIPEIEINLPDSTMRGLHGSGSGEERNGGWSYLSLMRVDDTLRVHYPGGAEWAALSLSKADLDRSAVRATGDYSMYSTLQLELKGAVEGVRVMVNLKDSDDPDDGSQTNVELVLGAEWQTHEIKLERFETADLKKLHVVLAFLFYDEPRTFFIRSARYH
jgi:hypothetical protein